MGVKLCFEEILQERRKALLKASEDNGGEETGDEKCMELVPSRTAVVEQLEHAGKRVKATRQVLPEEAWENFQEPQDAGDQSNRISLDAGEKKVHSMYRGEDIPDDTGDNTTGDEDTEEKVTRDNFTGDEVTGDENTGDKVTGEEVCEELSSSRKAAVEPSVETEESLKRTLGGPHYVHFLSIVRPFLQVLLEVLTGDAAEGFQKLQDPSLQNHWFYPDNHYKKIPRKFKKVWKVLNAFQTKSVLSLLLLASVLGGAAASPLPDTLRAQGSGRAEQGQAYSLTCVVEGLPGTDTTSSYIWYKDGKAIGNKTQHVLPFSKLTQDDAGNYQCKRSDQVQLLLSELFQLHVLVLENVVMMPEVEVEEGETVILNCSVHSVPIARLVWMMEGEILRRVESNSDSLVLHNASRFHLKVFHCQASNKEFFKVLGADTQIRIKGTYEVMPRPVLSMEGLPVLHQPLKLLCMQFDFPEHTAHIHLSHAWFKNSRKIPGQSGAELQFDSLTRKDRGMYSCVARNGKPETTSPESNKQDLLILLPPRVHIEPATPDNVIRRAAGEELTLTCKVTEAFPWVPAEGYSWSYLPSHQGPWRPLGVRESTLRLGPLTREDSGQYFCQARNDLEAFQGQIPPGNTSVTVDVFYMEDVILTSDLKVNEGDHVTLTCSVDSKPAARLTWIVDGQEVRHVTVNTDNYVLERAACSDSKTYTCRASNAELPGLEKNGSSNVQVVCNKNLTGLSFSSPSPPNSPPATGLSFPFPSPPNSPLDFEATEPAPVVQFWHVGLPAGLGVLALASAFLIVGLCLKKRKTAKGEHQGSSCSDMAQEGCRKSLM